MSQSEPLPAQVEISFYGEPWKVDLTAIRIRMAELDAKRVSDAVIAGGKTAEARIKTWGYRGWAKYLGVSHMTLRRLLEGTTISLECFNVILAGLGLEFKTVAVPAGPWNRRDFGVDQAILLEAAATASAPAA